MYAFTYHQHPIRQKGYRFFFFALPWTLFSAYFHQSLRCHLRIGLKAAKFELVVEMSMLRCIALVNEMEYILIFGGDEYVEVYCFSKWSTYDYWNWLAWKRRAAQCLTLQAVQNLGRVYVHSEQNFKVV